MNATLSAPRPLPSRQFRRRIVVWYGAGLVTMSAISVLGLFVPHQGAAWILMLLTYMAAIILSIVSGLRLSRPALLGLPDDDAAQDERQRARLAEVMAAAYRVLSVVLLVGLVALLLVDDGVLLRMRRTSVGPGLAVALIFLLTFLPSAVLAWTEPDPDREA
ncbi:hypothetical protein HNQ07_001566 [Deinococcus metalli]|uniref:Uncharacterized protein n=1 Tax=Deinococcus metalli TaxID=1141878 RepID=A0A7W8KGI2_9DEIO|nr:hypothetical protein [Deinococcus metalli]MBB5376109.1 hypothetical protein [Deinococcus metalli]GHF40729.1 hypothetical protein GCM10017781_16740 [Deinococcus metalli]